MTKSASRRLLFFSVPIAVPIAVLALVLGGCAPVAPPAAQAPSTTPATADIMTDDSVLLLAPQSTHEEVQAWVADNFGTAQVTIVSQVDASRPPDILLGVDNLVADNPFELLNNAPPRYTVDALPVAGQNAAAIAALVAGLNNDLLPTLGEPPLLPYVFDRDQYEVITFPEAELRITGVITVPRKICCPPDPIGLCVDCSAKNALVVEVPDEAARTQIKDWFIAQGITSQVIVQLPAEASAGTANITLSPEDVANLPPTVEEWIEAYRP